MSKFDDPIKNQDLIKSVAAQIRGAKKRDSSGPGNRWQNGRGFNGYETRLRGFDGLFEYIKTLPSTKVLDIGAGLAVAVGQLSKVPEKGQGLTFEATTLSGDMRERSSFKDDIKIYVAPSEYMQRVPSNEYGGAISVYSVCYSEAPDVVVSNIDRILIPGGVFKGTFAPADEKKLDIEGIKKPQLFDEAFKRKGYDTDVDVENGVLLALKPGANISAAELMKKDSDLLKRGYK